jgi:hypothetical protein
MPTSRTPLNKRSRAKKTSLVVIAVVLIVLGYFGFRWMRGLMMLGYVDSAVGRMRMLYAAKAQYAQAHPTIGYTCELSQLPLSAEIQRLLKANGIDNGYEFRIAGCQALNGTPNSAYYTSARPLHSGQPAFCSDQSGILKADYSGSLEKCRANGLPLY